MSKRIAVSLLALFLLACGGYEDHLVCYDASGKTIAFEAKSQQIWLSDGGYWNWRVGGTTIYRKADGPCHVTTKLVSVYE